MDAFHFGKEVSMMNEELSTQTKTEPTYKWSWGAFSFTWLWGIGNEALLTLFCLIPFFNIVWIFVCGAKGHEWAWKSGKFRSIEEFERVQQTWDRAGLVAFIATVITFLTIIFLMVQFIQALAYVGAYMDDPYYYSYY